MYYLHSKDKQNNKIIILGRKTWKMIRDEKDAKWDGFFERKDAEKEIKVLEALPEANKFWQGEISVVEL